MVLKNSAKIVYICFLDLNIFNLLTINLKQGTKINISTICLAIFIYQTSFFYLFYCLIITY